MIYGGSGVGGDDNDGERDRSGRVVGWMVVTTVQRV